MRKSMLGTLLLGFLGTMAFAGCPWSNSPNVFEASKGISLPAFNGPPPQTEPDLESSRDLDKRSVDPFTE